MYRLFFSFIVSLVMIASFAQTADIEVSYLYRHPEQTMRRAEADICNQYILLSNGNDSKFYSPKTEYIDSIESTPEGFESFNTFKRVCYEKRQSELIPRVDGSFYIVKSFGRKNIRTYDVASGTRFKWDEPLIEINWEVTDSIKNILGYECFMAHTDFHGRKWTVWFTPEIPVNDGPWKLHGLPGLILEAVCEGGQYHFVADGVQYAKTPYYKIYSEDNWEIISGSDFWNLRRSCLDNPSRNMTSSANIIVYNGISYKKYLPKEIVDYIETDYIVHDS
ncbi:MAG: GLPGLI family protein [Muribaculaceae bacterium]|nr:GLPGLI family protein [Muribaculaceae bacterium]